jgi:hypothetical protein
MEFMRAFIRHFWASLLLSLLVCEVSVYYLGLSALWPLLVLITIEIVFSFDNAIVNAKILGRLSPFWQNLFLTVGIVIAIFGMRLLFPIIIVALAAHLNMGQVWQLALHHPHQYADKLGLAHPLIAAFGGAFLLLLTLDFFLNGTHPVLWITKLERRLRQLQSWWLPALLTSAVVIAAALLNHEHTSQIFQAGMLGVITFLVMHIFTKLLGRNQPEGKHVTGWAAFSLFIYLQVLDASFSFDGVIGAFAITDVVVLIAAGLGVGALWVRSMTVYMVRRGTLDEYRYLEHGAYYTIGVLAAALFISLFIEVPDAVTGLIGVGIIGSAIVSSIEARKKRSA